MEKELVSEQDEKELAVDSEDVTTENVEDTTEKTDTSDEKVEENPYKKQIAELAIENRQKAGALKDERAKRKALEKQLAEIESAEDEEEVVKPKKYLTPEETNKLMEDKMRTQRLEDKLSQISNEDERKLVKHHLENSVVRTGNIENDLSMAIAIANKHLVDEVKKAEIIRNEKENLNARFSGGQSYSKAGRPSYLSDPIKKEAVELLKKLGVTDGEKYV